MLPLAPLLILAYAALYAFAYAIPKGYVELDVRDALSAAPKVEVANIQSRSAAPVSETQTKQSKARNAKRSTDAAGPLSMVEQGPVMESGTVTLNTGEGQGFWHRCEGLKC
ncbi:hypothetical protein BDZ85DRAFT_247371 [Elsinoe ampelina]|uniref:Uncharacterized protein n=1 Tax=Elsinoe ampelina TaxID=302913 RepID=A0A6A6GN87_9PEZI|nr:hypothetical protein BDZ85DRAFT_247371 [Elsinoe ampelina]